MERSLGAKRGLGIETELGTYDPSGDSGNAGSSFVRDYYPSWCGKKFIEKVPWDPEARLSRDQDARDEHENFRSEEWLKGSNHFLNNGARFYLDGAHAEISTPLCLTARQLLVWNRACYRLIDHIREKHEEVYGEKYKIFRNNVARRYYDRYFHTDYALPDTDVSGVSWGCHINYQCMRTVPAEEYIRKLGAGWLIVRNLISGAGKVGSNHGHPWTDFQISQRADFIQDVANLHTIQHRPIFNLRDVPYGDPWRYRRNHDICSDSNMLELPEYLKVGLTALVISMIEDDFLDSRFEFATPVMAFHSVSRDLECSAMYDMVNHKERKNILDILLEYRDMFWEYVERRRPRDLESIDLLTRFSEIVELLIKKDFEGLCYKLDWATKRFFIEKILAKRGKQWNSYDALCMDIEYHNNDHTNGLFYGKIRPNEQRIVDDSETYYAMHGPPPTRARWIAEILERYAKFIKTSNYWDKVSVQMPDSEDIVSFVFPEPEIEWSEPKASDLLALPLEDFLRRAMEEGIIRKERTSSFLPTPMDSCYYYHRPRPPETFMGSDED